MFIKCLFLIEHETDLDGQNVEASLDLVAQTFGVEESRLILFSGDDDLWRRQPGEDLIDVHDVFLAEVMVVAERQWCNLTGTLLQVDKHLFR